MADVSVAKSSGAAAGGDPWSIAKKRAAKIGYVPTSFSAAIRLLITDHNAGGAMSAKTKYQIARLMRGPSFQAMLYYATKELRGGYTKDQKFLTIGYMLDLFEPLDVACMIGAFLAYRKWRKLLKPEQWACLEKELATESQIGALAGAAIEEVGVGSGLLAGSFHYFALGTMLDDHEVKAKAYLQTIRAAGNKLNPAEETKLFGCSLAQVGTLLLGQLGFGAEIGDGFSTSLDPSVALAKIDRPMSIKMRYARIWIESCMAGLEQPREKLPAKYFPMASALVELQTKAGVVRKGTAHWLSRKKDDISETKTPELFQKVPEAESEVPDELRDIFTIEEISKMEVDDFDNLCDQMDAEKAGKAVPGAVSLSAKELKELEEMVS